MPADSEPGGWSRRARAGAMPTRWSMSYGWQSVMVPLSPAFPTPSSSAPIQAGPFSKLAVGVQVMVSLIDATGTQ